VGDVDAEQRVEVGGQRHDPVPQRVAGVAGAVPVGHRHDRALGDRRRAALLDPGDLHVAEPGHREGLLDRAAEEAEDRVETVVQRRVGALDVAQLGAGRHPAEQCAHPELALGERRDLFLGDLEPAGRGHDDVAVRHARPPRRAG
jgi:hypothetical protein